MLRGSPDQMNSDLEHALRQIEPNGVGKAEPRADARELIERLETLYRVRLPEDFKAFLLEASKPHRWSDTVGMDWYPIEAIKSLQDLSPDTEATDENQEVRSEAGRYLVFADYLDWCGYGYAICCSDGARRGHVAIVYPSPGRFICRSFTKFVELVAADSDRLHSTVGDHYADIV
jgi:hypothetical protein